MLDQKPDGNGAHKTANTTIPMYANFLFLESGETSSNGEALGLLELIIRINIAINQ